MSDCYGEDYVDCRDALLNNLTIAREKASVGKRNESKLTQYENQVKSLTKEIQDLTECANHLKDIYKNIQSYSKNHQQKARDILDLAIIEAGNLVPDADVEGIHLETGDNKSVYVVDSRGQDVNLREGGGYRVVLGALLRYACLKAQPGALPLILFDDQFFTLSDTTTASMKSVFEAMKRDITIVCIEQRKNAMDGITDMEYRFTKNGYKITNVERVL